MSQYTEIYNEWAQGMALDLPEPLIGHDATALKERKVLISGGKVFCHKKPTVDAVDYLFNAQC